MTVHVVNIPFIGKLPELSTGRWKVVKIAKSPNRAAWLAEHVIRCGVLKSHYDVWNSALKAQRKVIKPWQNKSVVLVILLRDNALTDWSTNHRLLTSLNRIPARQSVLGVVRQLTFYNPVTMWTDQLWAAPVCCGRTRAELRVSVLLYCCVAASTSVEYC